MRAVKFANQGGHAASAFHGQLGVRTNLLFTMSNQGHGRRRAKTAGTNSCFQCGRDLLLAGWWSQTGSNRRPHACKARALPTELWPRRSGAVVGPGRVELPTSRLSGVRSNHLSYGPPIPGQYVRRSGLPDRCRHRQGRPDQERPDHERLRPRRKRNEDGGVPPKWSLIWDLESKKSDSRLDPSEDGDD